MKIAEVKGRIWWKEKGGRVFSVGGGCEVISSIFIYYGYS